MTGNVEKAVDEIKRGKRFPVYLLHGDEFLAKEGARAICEALVPPDHRLTSVETITEDRDLASLPIRIRTVPLFGGTRVVVVHDSKAFLSKQTAEALGRRSREVWREKDLTRAARLLLQVVAAAGEGEGFLDRAARGEITPQEWPRVFASEPDPEAEQWLREVAGHAVAEGMGIPEADRGNLSSVYEETIERGIPPGAALILTAEVVDERRALFKKIGAAGFIIDCTIHGKRSWDTQMRPEAARAAVRRMVSAAGKTIDEEAAASILQRTGSGMRGLVSELQKLLLFVGSRPAVTTADVLEVFSSSREANIFDLTNALENRDAAAAVRAFRSLMSQREPVARILPMLAAEVRNLILARCALERRLDGRLDPHLPFEAFRSRILPRLAEELPADDGSAAKLLEMNPFRAFNLLRAASGFSLPGLLRGLEALHETDLSLKTSGQPEGLLVEQLLISLTAGGAGEPTAGATGPDPDR